MAMIGLGQARHIMVALIDAGVDRDLCWKAENGAVHVHEDRPDAEPYRLDITVEHVSGYRYAAYDNRADEPLHVGQLSAVALVVRDTVAMRKGSVMGRDEVFVQLVRSTRCVVIIVDLQTGEPRRWPARFEGHKAATRAATVADEIEGKSSNVKTFVVELR